MVIVYVIEDHTIYVGLNQAENEHLIRFSGRFMQLSGLVLMWFHVDKFSSPHAYIRLHEGEETPPLNLVAVACQIVKDGSIEGTKKPTCDVVWTPASNLAKHKGMNPGQVTFANRALVPVEHAIRKDTKILRQLEKVKGDITLQDLEAELEDLTSGKKKAKQKQPRPLDDGWGDDEPDWDEPAPRKPPDPKKMESMGSQLTQAEWTANMEDSFM
jgi:hypothetical protein